MAIAAATWRRIDGGVGLNQAIDETSTTQKHNIGDTIRCKDVSSAARGFATFIYLLGVASTAAGDAVTYNGITGATTRTLAATIGPLGVAMSANVANQYGWYQIEGAAVVTAGTVVAGAQAYTTSTDGSLDDAAVTGSLIQGAQFVVATDTGQAVVQLNQGGASAGAVDAII